MIQELHKSEYERVRPLFAEQPNQPVIHGVIEGRNNGRIFADHREYPRTALIWAEHELFFLAGDLDNEAFNAKLLPWIDNTLAPEARKIGDLSFQLEVIPTDSAKGFVESHLAAKKPKSYGRWGSVFLQDRFYDMQSAYPPNPLPPETELCRIDERVIAEDRAGVILGEVNKFWPSQAAFLAEGFGFCVRQGGQVLTCCLTVYRAGQDVEIGINTYDQQHRGQGLATAAANAFVRHCLAHDFIPHWTTELFREDSIVIAEKLGFMQTRSYDCYYFSLA
ncbi:MAG TPA: GNAT family N-acetyltransferase [Bacilli bacterium]|nr:GNAT family N-acetyltransferase [Bacilli bacterium]